MHNIIREACKVGFLVFCSAQAVLAASHNDPLEAAPGIFVSLGVHELMSAANEGAIGNSGFIIGDAAVAVIDPGGSVAAGERLKRAIRNVTDLPVRFLILTHFHPDHVAGASVFAEASTVVAHENYGRAMTQRAQFYLDRFPDIIPGSVEQVFLLPDLLVPVGETATLNIGGRQLTVEAHPTAHTDNDLTIHDEQTNTLWASDLVFAQRLPSLDGSLSGWLDVLSELDGRQYDLTIPGHGEPGEWEALVQPHRQYLVNLRDTVRKMLLEGIPLSDVLKAHDAGRHDDSHWQLYAAQHGTNLSKAYTELEWE